MTNWEVVARLLDNIYKIHVDYKNRFFDCPECDNSIYEVSWNDISITCPICGKRWEQAEQSILKSYFAFMTSLPKLKDFI